jgi:RNA recognition motif-containing protein
VLVADDHRIFVGDLGNEVNDDVLTKAFVKYPSFAKAKVVRDKKVRERKERSVFVGLGLGRCGTYCQADRAL